MPAAFAPPRGVQPAGRPTADGQRGARLVRRAGRPVATPVLDDAQRAVVEHRGGPLLVLAGPGTGKTTTIVEAVVRRVESGEITPDQALVLTFSRRAAAELRDRVAARLGRTIREPVARTFHSFSFGLLRAEAVRRGEPSPRLLSGPEQDLVVRELLRGDVEAGASSWPQRLHPALLTRGFAQELRDLLQRAVERGLSPSDLVSIGRRERRDDWVAAGVFARQYAGVSALREAASYDPAELTRAAVALLRAEPLTLQAVRAAHEFVVVDEYQDTDPAQEELLALVAGSRDLIAVGDPDQSIYAFRGADPTGIRRFSERFRAPDGTPARELALTVSRRAGPELLVASRRVAARLGGPGRHRELVAAGEVPAGAAEAHVLGSAVAQAAYVAYRLRRAHLLDGVEWSRMAVLARSAGLLSTLRRSLPAAGVPVATRGDDGPLVEVPIVRALLSVLELAAGRADIGADSPAGVTLAHDLLVGPLGGADPLALRRLRQQLRLAELRAGGGRSSAALLAQVLCQPVELEMLDRWVAAPARRVARVIAAARDAAAEPAATAETVLWAAWDASGLAARWAQLALSAAVAGPADRDLDAVVALFDTAARFADRLPKAGPSVFLDHLLGQQIPGDTIAARAPEADGVRLLTAHSAKGLEWDVVVVAGVQEGSWPDLRARGSLLGTDELFGSDEVFGTDAQPGAGASGAGASGVATATRAAAQLADERRLFYVAATRARRLLVVTAVRSDDEQPSRFLDELMPVTDPGSGERAVTRVPRALDLASLVGALRAVACTPATDERTATRRRAAAAQLARLAAAGVPGADPLEWYGLAAPSDDRPLVDDDAPVRVSPSRLEAFDRCGLRWLLESAGGTAGDSAAQGIGTMVHALAQQAALERLDPAAVQARFETMVDQLDLGLGWFAGRRRERAAAMVVKLVDWLGSNDRELLAVEQRFEITIGRAVLAGTVDRLEVDSSGRLVVVDLKTGRHQPARSELARHAQLGAYQLAVEAGAFTEVAPSVRESAGAQLVQLGTSAKTYAVGAQQALRVDAEPEWARELVERSAAGMAGQRFAATENALCRVCPVRGCCPLHDEGRAVTA